MNRSIKLMFIASTALALSACQKAPDAVEQTSVGEVETIDDATMADNMVDVPMADDDTANNSEVLNDQQLDESSDAMMAQQAKDEEDERLFEIVNPNTTNDIYVLRDKATGCEFVQSENDYSGGDGRSMGLLARPDGKGGQRGCRTGTDFKAAEAS